MILEVEHTYPHSLLVEPSVKEYLNVPIWHLRENYLHSKKILRKIDSIPKIFECHQRNFQWNVLLQEFILMENLAQSNTYWDCSGFVYIVSILEVAKGPRDQISVHLTKEKNKG